MMLAVTFSAGAAEASVGTPPTVPAGLTVPTTTTVPPSPTTTALPVPGHGPTTTQARTTTTALAPAATTTTSTTFPADLLAQSRAVKRTPPNNTGALLAALRPLEQLGYAPQQAAIAGMGQFPVAGYAYYADDWLEVRPGPVPKLHHGIDIVATSGTPLRAPSDGVLTYDTSDPTGYGLAAVVTAADHTTYLMAHMSATAKGLATGSPVTQGQVIGFVGSTGDSTGPHTHFEIRPLGGAGVDAKPFLDGWLKAALAAVPELIRSIQTSQAPPAAVAEAVPVPASGPGPGPGSGLGAGAEGGNIGVRLGGRPAGAVRSNPFTIAALLAILAVLAAWMPSARRRFRTAGADDAVQVQVPEPVPPPAGSAADEERLRRWRGAILARRPPRADGALAT